MANSSHCCVLCGANRKLEQSHIIPQFAYRWASDVSGTDERQVGRTRPMLCGGCEDRFSFYESEFARHVFHPLAENSIFAAKYTAWLRKFAASVCWRILEEHVATSPPGHPIGRLVSELESCRATWRSYLRDKRPDVAAYHLHLLPLGAVVNETSNSMPILKSDAASRLSLRTIESQVFCGEPEAFVYAKLGPVILIGLIADRAPGQWRGTRINAEGKLKPRDIFVPESCLKHILSGARISLTNGEAATEFGAVDDFLRGKVGTVSSLWPLEVINSSSDAASQ